MSTRALLRKPVGKHRYVVVNATPGTNITTAAWVVVIASVAAACDAFEYLNTTGKVIKLGVGATGSEIDIEHYLMPSSEPHIVPYPLTKGVQISAKAVDADATEDAQLVFNLYG